MSKQTLIRSLQIDLDRFQDLSEAEMAALYNQLKSIVEALRREGLRNDKLQPLEAVLSELGRIEILVDRADKIAIDLLNLKCNQTSLENRYQSWKSQTYAAICQSIWNDFLEIMQLCLLLKDPESNRKNKFSLYITNYLQYMKNFMNCNKIPQVDYQKLRNDFKNKCREGSSQSQDDYYKYCCNIIANNF